MAATPTQQQQQQDPGAQAATHTFLFADLVGFTTLTERHGDEAAADIALGFARAVEALAQEHGAQLVKLVGDCVMLRADRPQDAVRLGLALVRELPRRHHLPPVRAGAHTGNAVARGTDWFGATVNLAARITGLARGGELLVTEATAHAVHGEDGVQLVDLGLQHFRNVGAPVHILSARSGERRARHGRARVAVSV